ncbi:cation:proton antiporter domain-containing protein [Halococcus sp. AFM35]|uniref:cation:proton antiporter domain-containing protein n=1 Tax=Halococcus sp. AFM35 TaxID=3421653 RepID=UPI003EBA69F3
MATGGSLITLVATIIGLGVSAQVLADRFRVPSVLFLIITGILVGPVGLGIVSLSTFGNGLSTIVGLSVAIIMFEAAFHLKIEKFNEARSTTFRLVTVGAVIALVGTALAARFFLGASWDLAFLIGALLVATGPTVITPILQIVPVRSRVGSALELEGVTNDVTAAILAVAVFEFVIAPEEGISTILIAFAERLGTGILFGVIVAAVIWYLLNHVDLSPDNAPQNARLIVLAGALIAYGSADALFSEAGIAAAVTAGFVLGNADLPYEESIENFKGDVSLVVLSFVFITLGALIQFDTFTSLGLGGIAVVLAVALLIRPVIVFVSTIGGRISFREKLWMTAVSPRGIIPASVATLFALELQSSGMAEAATLLSGTVFLVILATVVFEGGFARHYAELLDIIPMRAIIVGGGKVGRNLATRLEDRGEDVVIVEDDEEMVETARNEGFSVHIGDGTDSDVLQAAGAENASTIVATTGDDDVNLLVAQLAVTTFDTEQVVSRVNQPENEDAFKDLDIETISSTMATSWAIDNRIERPALWNWMTELGRSGDVQEFEVTAEDVAGRTIAELGDAIPDGCLIALVDRDGENMVPDGDFDLRPGDRITLVGQNEAVQNALSRFHPHD